MSTVSFISFLSFLVYSLSSIFSNHVCLGDWRWAICTRWFTWSWISPTFHAREIFRRWVWPVLLIFHFIRHWGPGWVTLLNFCKLISLIGVIFLYKVYRQTEVVGVLVFHGSVCSFAYLNPKEPMSQALNEIKVLHNSFRMCFPLSFPNMKSFWYLLTNYFNSIKIFGVPILWTYQDWQMDSICLSLESWIFKKNCEFGRAIFNYEN